MRNESFERLATLVRVWLNWDLNSSLTPQIRLSSQPIFKENIRHGKMFIIHFCVKS